MQEEKVKEIQALLLPTIQKSFPQNMIRNDVNVKWDYGAIYTFKLVGGQVLYYGYTLVLYQIMDVMYVYENGETEKVGRTTYTAFIDKEDDAFQKIAVYEGSPERRHEVTNESLRRAIEEHIDSFGDEYYQEGCYFVANNRELLLTESAVLKAFAKVFADKLKDLPINLLSREHFDKGKYRLKIETLEVGYGERKGEGWGVLLEISYQYYKTLKTNKTDLIFHTGIENTKKAPSLDKFRNLANKIIKEYQEKYPEMREHGVEFTFKDENKTEHVNIYRKIQGTEEDTEKWMQRMFSALETHQEVLREKTKSIKPVDRVGVSITLKNNMEIIFGVNGIMLQEESYIYLKQEMNLNEGLQRLSGILGKNKITFDLMKVYDYRTKVKEEV